MTVETPLIAAFFATAGAVLIAVIGLMSGVHYRLGKLEQGQKTLAQEDSHTREIIAETRETLVKEDNHTREIIAETRETLVKEDAHTREIIAETRDTLVKEDAHTREMVVEGDAHTRELLAETREMLLKENAHTREVLTQEIAHTRELLSQMIMQEIAAQRERADAQHAETMAAFQRLTDALLSHSHDLDGTVRFRIPPPAAPPEDQEP